MSSSAYSSSLAQDLSGWGSLPTAWTVRPTPPPLFFFATGFWIVTVGLYTFCQDLTSSMIASVFALSIGVGLVVGFLLFLGYKRNSSPLRVRVLLCALGCTLGATCACAAAFSLQDNMKNAIADTSGSYYFEISEDGQAGEYGNSCIAKTTLTNGQSVHVRLFFQKDEPLLKYGDTIEAQVSLVEPKDQVRQYFWQKGLVGSALISTFEIVESAGPLALLTAFRKEGLSLFEDAKEEYNAGAVLMKALLFGDRSGLYEDSFYQEIRIVGLAHLVAVSGAHLAIVSAFLAAFLKALKLSRFPFIFVQVLFIVLYLFCTALPVSALRAACMASISLSSFFSKRRNSSLNALAICVVVLIAFSPQCALSVSFLFSVLSTLGIIVLGSLFRSWIKLLLPKLPSWMQEALTLTLSASLLTVPLGAAYFSQVSLVSPFSNVVAVPFFALLCTGGLLVVGVALIFPPLGVHLVSIALVGSSAFMELISLIARVPYASLPASLSITTALVVGLGIFVALWAWWPTLTRKNLLCAMTSLLACLLSVIIVLPLLSNDAIIMLNVGQGDAFVVRSQGRQVLIDTGNRDKDLLRGLGRQGIYSLDAVVVSHGDDDHCGSLPALKGVVQVGQVLVAADTLKCECVSCESLIEIATDLVGEEGIVPLSLGDSLNIGRFTLETIWPSQFKDEGGNADSLTLLLRTKSTQPSGFFAAKNPSRENWQALFCGDAEAEEIKTMVEEGRVGDIDVLKVGHHGSRVSLDKELIELLSPEVALVSAGAFNRYGHPADETLDLLESINCLIVRTDEEGDVVCTFKDGRLEVVALG